MMMILIHKKLPNCRHSHSPVINTVRAALAWQHVSNALGKCSQQLVAYENVSKTGQHSQSGSAVKMNMLHLLVHDPLPYFMHDSDRLHPSTDGKGSEEGTQSIRESGKRGSNRVRSSTGCSSSKRESDNSQTRAPPPRAARRPQKPSS